LTPRLPLWAMLRPPAAAVEEGEQAPRRKGRAKARPFAWPLSASQTSASRLWSNRLLGEEKGAGARPARHHAGSIRHAPWHGRAASFRAGGHSRAAAPRRAIGHPDEAVSRRWRATKLARCRCGGLVIDAQERGHGRGRDSWQLHPRNRAGLLSSWSTRATSSAGPQIDGKLAAVPKNSAVMAWAPVLVTSAVYGTRRGRNPAESRLMWFAQWCRRVPTSDLNKHF